MQLVIHFSPFQLLKHNSNLIIIDKIATIRISDLYKCVCISESMVIHFTFAIFNSKISFSQMEMQRQLFDFTLQQQLEKEFLLELEYEWKKVSLKSITESGLGFHTFLLLCM